MAQNRQVTKTYPMAAIIVLAVAVVGQGQEGTDGWHQWGGPTRNFHVAAAPLADSWPADGPPHLWSRDLGEGYSAIVAQQDLLVTMYREGEKEVVVALAAGSGSTQWQFSYDAPLLHDGYFDIWLNSAGPGPYATPLIAGDQVFALGTNGQLHVLDLQTGALQWSHNLVDLFALSDFVAFTSSPLVFGETVILPLGSSGHGVVAFDQETGAFVWQSENFGVAPSSAVLISVDGEEQLVVFGQQMLVGLDPTDGNHLWRHVLESETPLNIATPVWGPDNMLFVSAAYDGGSVALRLRQLDGHTTVEEVWSTNRMRVHFSNALRVGNLILGSSGDFGPTFLTAMDITTGEERWRERSFARSHMLYADGKVVFVDEDGEVAIASVSDAGLDVHARHSVLTSNAWTPPTLVDGTLYVRDRRTIVALDLSD